MRMVWYDRSVRELRIARVSLVLLCIALLLCTAIAPAAHLDLAPPPLVFCFLVVIRLSLLRISDGEAAAQPISFLTIDPSRAPPLA